MKYLFFIIFIIASTACFGQAKDSIPLFAQSVSMVFTPDTIEYKAVSSRMDTTILFKGIDTANHVHVFATEEKHWGDENMTLLIWIPPNRLTDGLRDDKQICELCLRHIQIKETRWYEDKYTKALERLKKIQDK